MLRALAACPVEVVEARRIANARTWRALEQRGLVVVDRDVSGWIVRYLTRHHAAANRLFAERWRLLLELGRVS